MKENTDPIFNMHHTVKSLEENFTSLLSFCALILTMGSLLWNQIQSKELRESVMAPETAFHHSDGISWVTSHLEISPWALQNLPVFS